MGKNSERIRDDATGEIVPIPADAQRVMPWQLPPVAPKDATPVKKYAGELPPAWNLKDHPDLDGKDIVIVHVAHNPSGEFGPFVVMQAWVYDPILPEAAPFFAILITGAEMIVSRVMTCAEAINGGHPVSGRLRAAGRSWQLD